MDKDYIENRKKELAGEFEKAANRLKELDEEAKKVTDVVKRIQGAYAEIMEQEKKLAPEKKAKKIEVK